MYCNPVLFLLLLLVGAGEYSSLFREEERADLLDVLSAFPSCQPPLERMVGA